MPLNPAHQTGGVPPGTMWEEQEHQSLDDVSKEALAQSGNCGGSGCLAPNSVLTLSVHNTIIIYLGGLLCDESLGFGEYMTVIYFDP